MLQITEHCRTNQGLKVGAGVPRTFPLYLMGSKKQCPNQAWHQQQCVSLMGCVALISDPKTKIATNPPRFVTERYL